MTKARMKITLKETDRVHDDEWAEVTMDINDHGHNLWLQKECLEYGSEIVDIAWVNVDDTVRVINDLPDVGFDNSVSPEFILRRHYGWTGKRTVSSMPELIAVRVQDDRSVRSRVNPIDWWW